MPPAPVRLHAPRKLLVAAIGVATINYVAACGSNVTTGNLPSPPPQDAAASDGAVPGPGVDAGKGDSGDGG